jgi:hypothetical protein
MRLFLILAVLWPVQSGDRVALEADRSLPPAVFAAAEIRDALRGAGRDVAEGPAASGPRIILRLDPAAGLKSQAYVVDIDAGPACRVTASDPPGLLYGGLEVAEMIRLGGWPAGLRPARGEPAVVRRGIKLNIPLDARTPSYSDAGDSAQQNIPEMWSLDFWRPFLDEMARHRYNVLTLWNLHPFPSLVKVPEYPDVALDDVRRTTVPFDDTFSLTGTDMVRPAMLQKIETVKRMSIDEKIRFWRSVMEHARDRGIEVYWFTWNVFTWGAEGKHGITRDPANPVTIDYFRRSVRELVLTYPLLTGIGITAGENLPARAGPHTKEQWLRQTYGQGILDALEKQPGRTVRVIHRYHQTSLQSILDPWKDYPGPFDLSFKFAQAHMYASPAPTFARKSIAELPADRRMWMTVRNDDFYNMRWGDPGFARELIRGLPGPDKLAGFYMGPDGLVWGREFHLADPGSPPPLSIQRHWYAFMLWGRLAYDPSLPDAHFERTLGRRFPGIPADKLFRAWACASKIVPLVTRFHWEDFDFQWYPEACTSHPKYKGFHTVAHFVKGRPMPGSGLANTLEDAVRVAEEMQGHARAARELAAGVRPAKDPELTRTLEDIEAMAHLGDYYAAKILGAAELAAFDRTGDAALREAAVRRLEAAAGHWARYADLAGRQYKPQLLTRLGRVDLRALEAKVREDVTIAREWKPRKER